LSKAANSAKGGYWPPWLGEALPNEPVEALSQAAHFVVFPRKHILGDKMPTPFVDSV
jgi:hypothetical protein